MGQISTFGCRINFYESELIREIVKDCPDCVVVNTCTVTAEAHRQSLQAIRKIRKEQPNAKIIVTGCAATIAPDDFREIADIVISNERKLYPAQYVKDSKCEPALVTGFEGRNRAFVQIQQGCDYRCTYCIVPKARGKSYSLPYEKIQKQIDVLLSNDIKEVVLTGINISDYEGGIAALTKKILRDFPVIRLRYGSLDPASIDDEMLEVFGDCHLLPHLHLSVQSGDNLILKRMARRHDREKVIEISKKLRAIRPNMILGADLIAGFPTETEACFENTLNLIREADLSLLHVFPYSERPGTPAAEMPQIDKAIRKQRAERLRTEGEALLKEKLQSRIGKKLLVLFETDEKGHCDEFLVVNAKGRKGDVLNVMITEVKNNELYGEVV